MIVSEITKVLWYTSILWQYVIFISEDAYGLNVSPPIWQTYINTILNSLQNKKYCEAIMDDLLLFTLSKKVHMDKLEDLLKALRKNGLKISPKKCQLLRTELQYMGNTIFIKERRVYVKPLHSRLETIQRVKAPTTAKQC